MRRGDLTEAQKEMVKGQKCLKTGLFQWHPDHASASLHFDAAAKAFQQAGAFSQATAAYEQLALCYKEMNE